MKIKLISMVVPAYKQEKTIVEDVRRIEKALSELPYEHEIIVVVDGFMDKTMQRLKNASNIDIILYGTRLVRKKNSLIL